MSDLHNIYFISPSPYFYKGHSAFTWLLAIITASNQISLLGTLLLLQCKLIGVI